MTPADNGYVLNGNASDANSPGQTNCNKIAKDEKEVKELINKYLDEVFTPTTKGQTVP